MKVKFYSAEDGELIIERDSEEIREILPFITKQGAEVNIYFSKSEFVHGYVDTCMYQIDEEDKEDSLCIYILSDSETFKEAKIYRKLDQIKNIIENL